MEGIFKGIRQRMLSSDNNLDYGESRYQSQMERNIRYETKQVA
jgi:hypothetical protein